MTQRWRCSQVHDTGTKLLLSRRFLGSSGIGCSSLRRQPHPPCSHCSRAHPCCSHAWPQTPSLPRPNPSAPLPNPSPARPRPSSVATVALTPSLLCLAPDPLLSCAQSPLHRSKSQPARPRPTSAAVDEEGRRLHLLSPLPSSSYLCFLSFLFCFVLSSTSACCLLRCNSG